MATKCIERIEQSIRICHRKAKQVNIQTIGQKYMEFVIVLKISNPSTFGQPHKIHETFL